jgi:hypothetical protein
VRRTAAVLLLAALLSAAGAALAGPAMACSCTTAETAAHVARADAIFTGRLVSREVSGGSSSADPALHVFAVAAVWKGEAAAQQGVVSAASGASCGLELQGEGPFVVFATRSGDGLAADLCGGTAAWSAAIEGELSALTRRAVPQEPAPGAAGDELPGGVPWVWVTLAAAALAGAGVVARRWGTR